VNDILAAGTPSRAPGGSAAGAAADAPAGLATGGELVAAISAVRRTWRRATRAAWAQQPLPPAQSELLRLAVAQPGLSVAEAARELHLAPNTVSTLVSKLTGQGLLNRGRDASDRRAALLTATGKARQRVADWRDLRAELAGRALAGLPAADQQALTQAIPALWRLAEQLEAQ
jgi:DNA-binding MarR family transcriptional regulator